MNPGHFQDMSGMRTGPQAGQQVGPQGNGGSQQVQQLRLYLQRMLQQQQIPQGWQSNFPLPSRLSATWQIFTSLRLLPVPQMNIEQLISVTINFEKKVFYESPDQATYERTCHEKLRSIAEKRNNQAENRQQMQNAQQPQMNIVQQPMPIQSNVPNSSFQQFQQNAVNPQTHIHMQMMNPAQQPPQAKPQSTPVGYDMMNPPANLQKMPQNVPLQAPHISAVPALSQEEEQQVQNIAMHMRENATAQTHENIRNRLQSLSQDQLNLLASQGIDPSFILFRQEAIKKIRQHKMARSMAAQQNNGPNQGSMGNVCVPQQQRPTSQNAMTGQVQQPGIVTAGHGFDPSFRGNMDQILGQQQDALRSQEAGQMVVPASNGQVSMEAGRMPNPGNMSGRQGHGRPGQKPAGMPGIPQRNQQPFFQTPQMQHPFMQEVAMRQGTPNNQGFTGMSPQYQQQLEFPAQGGGVENHFGQRPPHQTPNMPNLNRPLDTNTESHRAQAMVKARSNQPGMPPNNFNGSEQVNPRQPAPGPVPRQPQPQAVPSKVMPGQTQPRAMTNVPPHIRQQLSQMSEVQKKAFVLQWQQNQLGQPTNPRPTVPGDPLSMQTQRTQMGPQPQSQSLQQPPPTRTQPVQIQNGMANEIQGQNLGANLSKQPGPQQQFPEQQQLQLQRMREEHSRIIRQAAMAISPEHLRSMDQDAFPPAILGQHQALSQIPGDCKTWGQLKQWVREHANVLPPIILNKLTELQAMHFQRKKQHALAMNAGQIAQQNGQQQPRPAPQAQMGLYNSMQTVTAPQYLSAGGVMQTVPQPTVQEIHAARAREPEALKTATDEQVRELIFKRRQEDMWKAAQGQQEVKPQQQAPQAKMHGSSKATQRHPPPTVTTQDGHKPTHQRLPSKPNNKTVLGQSTDQEGKPVSHKKSVQAAQIQAQPKVKGVKRNNIDDVVEVPNPNMVHSPNPPQFVNDPKAQTQMRNGIPQVSADLKVPASQMDLGQRQGQQQHDGGQASDSQRNYQATKPPLPPLPPHKAKRLQQLKDEVMRTLPHQAIAMSVEARGQMIHLLHHQSITRLVHRVDPFINIWYNMNDDENTLKELIRMRMRLLQQYVPGGLAEHFTITLGELKMIGSKLSQSFQQVMSAKASQGNSAQSIDNNQQMTQAAIADRHALNAANLEQQQLALKASVQRERKQENRAPAAPTSAQPPFSFGAQSPHGVPQYPGPNDLTQERLKFPPAKRRKNNQSVSAESTPAQTYNTPISTSSPQFVRVAPPDAQRQQPVAFTIRCHNSDCDGAETVFTSKVDLERHIAFNHPPKEAQPENPLQWCFDSIRLGLGLDENGRPKELDGGTTTDQTALEAPKMKASASSQSQRFIKQEATAMSRNGTQNGPSPARNALSTPQAAHSVRTPASENKVGVKDKKALETRSSLAPTAMPLTPPQDPWATSSVSSASIIDCFSTLNDLQTIPWSQMQHTLTPESTMSSNKSEKNSPTASDISENDALNIEVNTNNWIPEDWLQDPHFGGLEALTFDDDLMKMDFDTAFGKEEGVFMGNEEGRETWKGKKDGRWQDSPAFRTELYSFRL